MVDLSNEGTVLLHQELRVECEAVTAFLFTIVRAVRAEDIAVVTEQPVNWHRG